MAPATKTLITLSHAEDPNIPRSCERRQAFPASLSPKQGNSDFFFQESCTFGFDFIRHSFLCGTYRNVASPCGYISRFLAVLLFICKTNIFKSCFPSFSLRRSAMYRNSFLYKSFRKANYLSYCHFHIFETENPSQFSTDSLILFPSAEMQSDAIKSAQFSTCS